MGTPDCGSFRGEGVEGAVLVKHKGSPQEEEVKIKN